MCLMTWETLRWPDPNGKKVRFPTKMQFVKVSLAAVDRVCRSHVADGGCTLFSTCWRQETRARFPTGARPWRRFPSAGFASG